MWHWWIVALVLLTAEILVPGTFFLWTGISAAVVGLLLLLLPDMSWQWQAGLFGVLSVVTIVLWRWRLATHPAQTDQPTLNRRGEQYVGRVFTLSEPIKNNVGKIYVDDSTWKIDGVDLPAGSQVRVVRAEGTVLHVEAEDG